MEHQLLQILTSDPDRIRRGRIVALTALLFVGFSILLSSLAFIFPPPIRTIVIATSLIGLALYSGAYVLARRGRIVAGGLILLVVLTLLPIVQAVALNAVLITPLLLSFALVAASLMLRSNQIWIVLIAAVSALLIAERQLSDENVFNGAQLGTILVIITGLVMLTILSYLGARNNEQSLRMAIAAQQESQASAAELAVLNQALEQQVAARTAALEHALADLQTRNNEQERLLTALEQERNTVAALNVPILPVGSGALVAPLIGALDEQRMADATRRILAAVEQRRSNRLIIDITGLPVVDSAVAQGLLRIVQATYLLGTQTVLVGIRPEVAQTLVALGVDLGDLVTKATLQSALDDGRG
ncbi:MAG: STAS domain-containing protein [Oscillochloris sp.]|nr:STAS domain-containing protein [Oscillochloris sp.]